MTDPVLKLQILARAEMAMARIHARRAANRSGYFAIALVLALLGMGMLTFACYLALLAKFSPPVAALLVALGDLLLAGIVVMLARRIGENSEEERMVRDIREMAYSELGADVEAVKQEFAKVGADVRRIKSGFSSFSGSAGSSLQAVLPIINMLIKVVKRDKSAPRD